MPFYGAGNVPLVSKNRLGYAPPNLEHTLEHRDETLDLTKTDILPPKSVGLVKSKPIISAVSTFCSHFLVLFFRSLIGSFLSAQDRSSASQNDAAAPAKDDTLELDENLEFPGASTPLTNSVIIEDEQPALRALANENKCKSRPPIRNIYESVYNEASTENDDVDDADGQYQYGTNLRISETSKYKPHFGMNARPLDQTDVTAAELLDTELPTLDEYDKVITNFYAPFKPVPQPKYSLTDAMLAAIPSYNFSQVLKKEREKIQALIFQERKAAESSIRPLNKLQLASVENLWRSRLLNSPVVSDFNIDITVKDIKTLADACWLNDNVIDFYLNLLAARSNNIFCWTTHFFSTLKSKGYQGVARWAKRKKVNLVEKDLVIVPINIMGTHWAVAVIDNQAKLISYYDSLSSRGNLRALELLEEYMSKESERLLMPQISYTLNPCMKTPQQQNGYDCGVFTCTVSKFICERADLTFGQKDMPLIRRRMAFEIMNKSLLDHPNLEPHL